MKNIMNFVKSTKMCYRCDFYGEHRFVFGLFRNKGCVNKIASGFENGFGCQYWVPKDTRSLVVMEEVEL